MNVDRYFDLDDIIATEQKTLCKIRTDNLHPSFFDPNSANSSSSTKIELPCWLAEGLMKKSSRTISVELPRSYRASYREILNADAHVCDLHKLGPYFYDFGRYLVGFCSPEKESIIKLLVQTLVARILWLMDVSQNSQDEQRPLQLDKFECQLYDLGRASQQDYAQWIKDKSGRLESTDYVQTKKRKYHQMS